MIDRTTANSARTIGNIYADASPSVTRQVKPEDTFQKERDTQVNNAMLLLAHFAKSMNPMTGGSDPNEFFKLSVSTLELKQSAHQTQVLQENSQVQREIQNLLAANLIDRTVEIPGAVFEFDGKTPASLHYTLPEKTTNAEMVIKNDQDAIIYQKPIETIEPGKHTFEWEGQTEDGTAPKGTYSIQVFAENDKGSIQKTETIVPSRLKELMIDKKGQYAFSNGRDILSLQELLTIQGTPIREIPGKPTSEMSTQTPDELNILEIN